VASSGQQGFGGDGGSPTGAILNSPRAAASGASGNLAIADKFNQRLRAVALPTLTFTNDGVGILSAAQSVTLANTGSAPITVASIVFTGTFTAVSGGSCGAAPITLAAGANCTQNIAFLPTAPGAANGLAAQVGGGTDYRLSDRFAIRILDAEWSRTQLPNGTDNVQNALRLGAGIVLRFAH
jgi:hypothetical protein